MSHNDLESGFNGQGVYEEAEVEIDWDQIPERYPSPEPLLLDEVQDVASDVDNEYAESDEEMSESDEEVEPSHEEEAMEVFPEEVAVSEAAPESRSCPVTLAFGEGKESSPVPDERVENEVGVAKSDEQKDPQRSLEKPAAVLASPDRATTRRTTARGRRGLPPSPPTEYAAARPRRSGTLKRSYEEPQSGDEDNNDDGSGTYGVRTSRAPKRICAEKENEPSKTKPKKPKVQLQGRLSAAIMALLCVEAGSSVCDGTTAKECGQQLAGSDPEDLVKHLHKHYTSLTDSDTKVLCCMRGCSLEIAPNQLTRHIRQHHLNCEYKCLLPLYAPEHKCAFHTKRSDLVRSHFIAVHEAHIAILQAALKGEMP